MGQSVNYSTASTSPSCPPADQIIRTQAERAPQCFPEVGNSITSPFTSISKTICDSHSFLFQQSVTTWNFLMYCWLSHEASWHVCHHKKSYLSCFSTVSESTFKHFQIVVSYDSDLKLYLSYIFKPDYHTPAAQYAFTGQTFPRAALIN